jgi:hypothetical protein
MKFSGEWDEGIMMDSSEVAGIMSCHYPVLSRKNACQVKHITRQLISDSFQWGTEFWSLLEAIRADLYSAAFLYHSECQFSVLINCHIPSGSLACYSLIVITAVYPILNFITSTRETMYSLHNVILRGVHLTNVTVEKQ